MLLPLVCLADDSLGSEQGSPFLITVKEPEAVFRTLHLGKKQRGEQTAQGSRTDYGNTHIRKKRSFDLLNNLGIFNNDHIAVSGAKILVGPDCTFNGNDVFAFWRLGVGGND